MTGARAGAVVLAPDKFRGSLTAAEVSAHLAAGVRRARPGVELRTAPVADGGEGTVDVLLERGFVAVARRVAGPTGRPVRARLAVRDDVAVVELAQASGLARLPAGPDPLRAGSEGTGELLRAALDAGCRRVVLGLGGSACTDGGAGMVRALGGRLLDRRGRDVRGGGAALAEVDRLVLDGLDPRLAGVEVVVASDVDNPLLGPHGAASVYGPQKGATPDDVALLDAALGRWADVVARATGRDASGRPGAGAAGGVGFAALAVLGVGVRPGIDVVLELAGFRALLDGAALVVTGEGSLDAQTLRGKAPAGVARAAAAAGVPAVAVAGRSTLSADDAAALGLRDVRALTDLEPDPARCLADAGALVERAAEALAREWVG